jgi:putative transposase
MPLYLHKQIREQAKGEADAFNCEEQWMAERVRRIRAIRAIDKTANREQVAEVTRLLEIPRIHAVTGNIVDVSIEPPEAVTIEDFIAHDVPAARSIDDEIRSPRVDSAKESARKPKRISARDRRDAGQPHPTPSPDQSEDGAARPRRSGSSRKTSAAYK